MADPITPVTLIGAVVLFFVIAVTQEGSGWRVALGSAAIGAAAAPMIFELPSIPPAVRLRRTTLFCFAGMLAAFAVWTLFGFSYPSAPGPIALNTLAKRADLTGWVV